MSPWYAVALLWFTTAVIAGTHWFEQRRTPDQRQVDDLARRDRTRR